MNLHYEGTLTKKDLRDIYRLSLKLNFWSAAIYYVIALIFLSVFLILFLKGSLDYSFFILLLFFLIFFSYRLWLPYLSANSQMQRDPNIRNKIQGTITDEVITIETATSSSTIRWDLFSRIKVSENTILLYHGNGNLFNFLSRAFCTETDWNELNRFIEQRILTGKTTDVLKTTTIIFFGRRLGKTGTVVYLVALGFLAILALLYLVIGMSNNLATAN